MWVCLLLIGSIYNWSALFCLSKKLGSASVLKIEFGGSLGGFVLGFVWVFSSFTQIFFWIPKVMWCVHYKEIIVVKTRWIDMLFLSKCVMEKYWLQIMKMHVNHAKNNIDNEIWTSFVIWSWLWGCMPFATLDCVHMLIKFIQSWDDSMCDIINVVKVYQVELIFFTLIFTQNSMTQLLLS